MVGGVSQDSAGSPQTKTMKDYEYVSIKKQGPDCKWASNKNKKLWIFLVLIFEIWLYMYCTCNVNYNFIVVRDLVKKYLVFIAFVILTNWVKNTKLNLRNTNIWITY